MTLEEQTKQFIEKSVRNYYYKAIEHGAVVSVEYVGLHTYEVFVGNMKLIYFGTADSTAIMISCEGDVF